MPYDFQPETHGGTGGHLREHPMVYADVPDKDEMSDADLVDSLLTEKQRLLEEIARQRRIHESQERDIVRLNRRIADLECELGQLDARPIVVKIAGDYEECPFSEVCAG